MFVTVAWAMITIRNQAAQLAQGRTDRALSLDTLGWIWYKLGDLKQARSFIEEAVTLREPDIYLYGPTSKSGDRDRAGLQPCPWVIGCAHWV
jgi:hypothetical protein